MQLQMEVALNELNINEAARLREEMFRNQDILKSK